MDNIIIINKDNFGEYSSLDAVAFMMATNGDGSVDILTADGNCYQANMSGGYPLPAVLPLLDEIEEDPGQNPDVVPDGWCFRSSFLGYYLFYKESLSSRLEKGYLDKLPDDVLDFNWDLVVKTINGDKSARIELMNEYYNSIEGTADELERLLHEFSCDKDGIELLKDYYTSGQWENDREALRNGEIPEDQDHEVLDGEGLKSLLDRIESIKENYRDTLS
jgi:hypothetical protein